MKTIALLVKNGIGYGHIRRALLLARALKDTGRYRPVIISQAGALDIFATTSVPVVNLPLLHRVPSAVTEDCYTEILDELLRQLSPALVIEDTYPDPRYLALPALQSRPRLLVMRRMDAASFDTLRITGRLNPYDAIALLQTPDEFAAEGHSPDSHATVLGGRFTFVGNISHVPSAAEVAEARRHASVPADGKLVVVAAGAGGDQMPDGYGDRLFSAALDIAKTLHAEGVSTRFVVVTGPYYAGRELDPAPNTTVRRFDPHLAALVGAADVALIKPGNNLLSEALRGNANLVLVPDVSFMEGVEAHASRVAETYGGAVVAPDHDEIEKALRDALDAPGRTRRPDPGIDGLPAVQYLVDSLLRPPRPEIVPKRLALILSGTDLRPDEVVQVHHTLDEVLLFPRQIPSLRSAPNPAPVAIADTVSEVSPQAHVDAGLHMLLVADHDHQTVEDWLAAAPPSRRLFLHPMITLRAVAGAPDRCEHQLAELFSGTDHLCVRLDLQNMTMEAASAYLHHLGRWIESQPVHLCHPKHFVRQHANALLEGRTP